MEYLRFVDNSVYLSLPVCLDAIRTLFEGGGAPRVSNVSGPMFIGSGIQAYWLCAEADRCMLVVKFSFADNVGRLVWLGFYELCVAYVRGSDFSADDI